MKDEFILCNKYFFLNIIVDFIIDLNQNVCINFIDGIISSKDLNFLKFFQVSLLCLKAVNFISGLSLFRVAFERPKLFFHVLFFWEISLNSIHSRQGYLFDFTIFV